MFNPENPPEITASRWLNSEKKITLKSLRGKVVVIAVCQIACPGSVKYGLPQATRLRRAFSDKEVAVLGLHMAFEKFDEQTPELVQKFLADSGIDIPVAYDKPNGEEMPVTMTAYELQGTPAMLIFDRLGRLRRHYLGAVDDLRVGAEVMGMLMEDKTSPKEMAMAIEAKLRLALVDPREHEHGDGCGCGHDHHDHGHDHAHDHGGDQEHDHAHDEAHAGSHAAGHGEPGHVHGPGCKH